MQDLAQAPLAFVLGTAWGYSFGIDVIGAVLEAAADKSLDDTVRNEVMTSLGLAGTGFFVADKFRLATPYTDGRESPARMEGAISVPLEAGAVRFAPERVFDPESFTSGGAGMAAPQPTF